MGTKAPSAIKKIILNKATFSNEPVGNLALVNFFYGNNGTGKTTMAHCIKSAVNSDDDNAEWYEGRLPGDFEVAVYDQRFISENFSNYNDLKGVFTVNKTNIEIQNKINEKTEECTQLQKEYSDAQTKLKEKEIESNELLEKFKDYCFKKTKDERYDFDSALEGRKQKKNFVEVLLLEKNPENHDYLKLKQLCETAFDNTAKEYPLFNNVNTEFSYENLPGSKLLDKPIISRSDAPFAQFIKALNATDWVRTGYENYVKNSHGRCPFCRSPLPPNFEADIANCFDEQYQKDINDLIDFQKKYISEMGQIINTLKYNTMNDVSKLNLHTYISEYKIKLELLEKNNEINTKHLEEKINEPTKAFSLENLKPLLLDLNNIINVINQSIKENNDVVKSRRMSKEECRNKTMQYFAYLLKEDIKNYLSEKKSIEKDIKNFNTIAEKISQELVQKEKEVNQLNAQTVNTSEAMNAINKFLAESGFQGFKLRAKKNSSDTYEVIRQGSNEPATNLSEGERNFIAFLYFNQQVCGSLDKNPRKNKIVVIDDPVSSMDSTSLFFVSGIVKNMIRICKSNDSNYRGKSELGAFIKQIFIMTHNVYFHNEITRRQVNDYKRTSFYLLTKNNNVSTVKLCERDSAIPTEKENYNPVQNSYAALWNELRETQSANSAKNIMRRILEYYFLQMCGYEDNLLDQLLEKEDNKKKFIVPIEGGQPDTTKYNMAFALLSYINPTNSFDDIYYTEDKNDIEAYKEVFHLIFEVLGQEQHYNMMMGIPME